MIRLPKFALPALTLVAQGPELHLRALQSVHDGEYALAARLFDAAARCYRRDLEVAALARLRVHELMAQVRSGADASRDAGWYLEIERRLCTLDEIETLEPPFARVDARELVASWQTPESARDTGAGDTALDRAA